MAGGGPDIRVGEGARDLDAIEPLWHALQERHAEVLPRLGSQAPPRSLADSWPRRRARYEEWLAAEGTFFLLAEADGRPLAYAFVTIGPAYASWATGRLATLETLSVLPAWRGSGLGGDLIAAAWRRLDDLGIEEMAITSALANTASHRFYERHGFEQSFVIFYGRRPAPGADPARAGSGEIG